MQEVASCLERRRRVKHSNLVSIGSISSSSSKGLCSHSCQISFTSEFFPKSLESEMIYRIANNLAFTTVELISILHDCVV